MKASPHLRTLPLSALLLCLTASTAQADSIPVRNQRGSIRGFLELRSEDGRLAASGDFIQTAHGDRITSETVFHFPDGSVDDEITVYTQRRTLQLLSDHRIQKGRFFPHPMDTLIDARTGQVTVRSVDKDGNIQTKIDHPNLPPDIANGMVSAIVENMKPADGPKTVTLLIATPRLLTAKLVISPVGQDAASVAGKPRKAIHYTIKIDLTGIAGILAPVLGKTPPDIQIWTIGADVPTFAREQGPLYPGGPMMTIQLTSPIWSYHP